MRSRLVPTLGLLSILAALSGVSASPAVMAAAPDIVIYASDVSQVTGLAVMTDSTAAGERKLSSPDNGWSSTQQPPPPSSAPVATFMFEAPAAGDYRVWLRMRGQGNSKWNESVWVQFSDATRNGAAAYRWGTNDGLLVNLENCSSCGIQEWGWQDNSWWLNQSSLVTLPQGTQHLYVTLREDGVEFDQIVLSPERYLASAPGPVKNDTTILAKSPVERIGIEHGSLVDLSNGDGRLQINGTDGFSMSARISTTEIGSGQFDACGRVGCPAGQETPFRGHWTGFDVGLANVNYRGTHYPVNGFEDLSTIDVRIAGYLKTPPRGTTERQEVTVSAAFHYGSVFRYEGAPGTPTGAALVTGGGIATFTLWWSVLDDGWYFGSADFTFVDPAGLPVPSTTEIVLYASDAVTLSGLSLAFDSTAAGGWKITSTDSGRDWLEAPPAPNTAPYATFAFNVPATGNYRVWLRLRGQANSKWNESVWVQFSDATRNNNALYRWGTSDGLLVNLEDCFACGIQGWGWQDNSWWLNQSSLVTLREGMQTLYVTLREDGVELDQIVLSREKYLSAAPGPVKNDTMVVQKPATPNQVHFNAGAIAYEGGMANLSASGPERVTLTSRFGDHDGTTDAAAQRRVNYSGGGSATFQLTSEAKSHIWYVDPEAFTSADRDSDLLGSNQEQKEQL